MQMGETQTRGISSAVLKNIAVVTMLIDHIGAVIVMRLLIQRGIYTAMVHQEVDAWMIQNAIWKLYGNADHRKNRIPNLLFPVGGRLPEDP